MVKLEITSFGKDKRTRKRQRMDSTARFSVFSLPTIKHNVEFCKPPPPPPPPRAAVIAPLPSWLSLARLFTGAISFHFIALFLSDTLALSHKLAWISRASEGGEECRVRGTKEKKRGSLSSQSEGKKKNTKKSHTLRRQRSAVSRFPAPAFVPASFLNSNYGG